MAAVVMVANSTTTTTETNNTLVDTVACLAGHLLWTTAL